jgi:hypothetical protein
MAGMLVALDRWRPLDAHVLRVAEKKGAPLLAAVFGVLFLLIFRDSPYALLLAAVACLYAVVAMANNLTTGLLGLCGHLGRRRHGARSLCRRSLERVLWLIPFAVFWPVPCPACRWAVFWDLRPFA